MRHEIAGDSPIAIRSAWRARTRGAAALPTARAESSPRYPFECLAMTYVAIIYMTTPDVKEDRASPYVVCPAWWGQTGGLGIDRPQKTMACPSAMRDSAATATTPSAVRRPPSF